MTFKILHVLDHSLPLHSGYVFRTLAILEGQHRLGWQTFQLTTPKHRIPSPPVETIDGWTFYRTRPLGQWMNDIPLIGDIAGMAATAARLNALAATLEPDILHAHSPVLNAFPAWLIGHSRGIPLVYEVRAFWEDAAVDQGSTREGSVRYRMTRALETAMMRRADAVTTICEGLKRDIVNRGIPEQKVTVVPNAVNLAEFRGSLAPEEGLRRDLCLEGKTVLGFIGSFYPYEGLDLLLEALARLAPQWPDMAAVLVGNGPHLAYLKDLLSRLQIGGSVRLVGSVPHAEVNRYYALCDVLVYPRRSMRLTELVTPLKPLESMAMSRPVIASDVGGHRELIEDRKTGFLFPPDDPAALGRAIENALDRRAEWPEMTRRARAFVERERSWDSVVKRYEPVYARIIEGKKRCR